MLLLCQLSAYLSAKDAPLDCSQLASYMKRVCMQKDMSTCPNAVVVSTVSIFVSMSQGFSRTIPWQTIVNHSMPYLTMANHNKSFHAIPDHEFGAPRCKTYNPHPKAHNPNPKTQILKPTMLTAQSSTLNFNGLVILITFYGYTENTAFSYEHKTCIFRISI